MFTGIIEKIGIVKSIKSKGKELELRLENPFKNEVKTGDSIAVDGTCLTVETVDSQQLSFFVSAETVKKSTVRLYKTATVVNLERAMSANKRFDGHIVQGHVDTTGKIEKMHKVVSGMEITVLFNSRHKNSVVEKGSVSVNGVSLTAFDVRNDRFSVSMIPETLKQTTFSSFLKQGSEVNIEFDILGKYVARIIENRSSESNLKSLLDKL